MPPIGTEVPLLKDKFLLPANTLHAFQRERDAPMTPSNVFLKTLLKEFFTNKGEILSCKSIKPCKNRQKKISRAYYVRTRDKSGSNSPPPRKRSTVKCPGEMLKFRIDRRIIAGAIIIFSHQMGVIISNIALWKSCPNVT